MEESQTMTDVMLEKTETYANKQVCLTAEKKYERSQTFYPFGAAMNFMLLFNFSCAI